MSWLDVKDFGAVGDGVIDDTAAIQAAIDAAEEVGNGARVYLPRGNYKIAATLTVNKGIHLGGDGYGDVTGATSNSMTSAAQGTTLVWAGGPSPMVKFISATTNETLHGGGIEGLLLDAANVATICVQVSSCRHTKVDIAARRYVTQAILLDDTNGRLCSEVFIPRFVGRIEGNAGTQSAHGIYVKGDVSVTGFGCTSIYMGNLDIEHENGDALRFEDCDSCFVAHLKAANRTGSYTGQGVRFMQGDGSFPARKNYIAHLARGRVVAEGETANAAGLVNSEGGGASGAGIFHYQTIDRSSGELFQSLIHRMDDFLTLPAAAFHGNATLGVVSGHNWAARLFSASSTEYMSAVVPMMHEWGAGRIAKFEVLLARAQAAADSDVRLQADLAVVADGEGFTATPSQQVVTQTIPTSTGKIQRATITFDTPVSVAGRGQTLFVKLSRFGADVADTYTGLLGVFALRIYFAATGPDDPGTGIWYVPPVSVYQL